MIAGARRIPISRLLERVGELDPSAPTLVYCAGGYRSSIAASLLRSRGFEAVADLQGGFAAWVAAGLPVGRRASADPAGPDVPHPPDTRSASPAGHSWSLDRTSRLAPTDGARAGWGVVSAARGRGRPGRRRRRCGR